MKQSRGMSFAEALTNIVVGFGINVVGQIIAFAFYDIQLTAGASALISLAFTGVSLARSYILRRIFESIRVGTWTTSFSFGKKRTETSRATRALAKQEKQTCDYTPAGTA